MVFINMFTFIVIILELKNSKVLFFDPNDRLEQT